LIAYQATFSKSSRNPHFR